MSFIAKWEDVPAIGNCAQCQTALVDALRTALPNQQFESDGQGVKSQHPLDADASAVANDVLSTHAKHVSHYHWQKRRWVKRPVLPVSMFR